MSPTNGELKLVSRYFFFPKTLFGSKKRGWQKVYKRFWKDYVNHEAFEIECWSDYCWYDQPERVI
jgi:hypothetical protein